MPKFRGNQVRVYVTLGTLKYGWKQNEKKFNALKTSHGIKTAVGEIGVFYGANSPKPGVASKKDDTGMVSSFYDPSKTKTLLKAGWNVNNNDRTQGIRNSGLSQTVCVDTPHGYKYAWNIDKADKAKAIALGAEVPTSSNLLVWGSFPKPPRASIKDSTGSFSTFIPPTVAKIQEAVEKGYSVSSLDDDWNPAP